MLLSNRDVATIIFTLADYMEVDGANPFRVNAYRRAAQAVENLKSPLNEQLDELTSIEGIGRGTAAVIREIALTGELQLLDEYKAKVPASVMQLLHIPGLGPKTVKTVFQKLGVTDIPSLKQAIVAGNVRKLPGFGPKKEANILAGIERFGKRPERLLLGQALPLAEALHAHIQVIPGVEKACLAGSVRRMRETVKDVDLIVATTDPVRVATAIVRLPDVAEVISHGETKVTILFDSEQLLQVDVRLVKPAQFATTLHHFTGSKEHNVRIRQLAKQKGWKVNEYGVERQSDAEIVTFPSETAFYEQLGLPYIPPELREGEALPDDVPALVQLSDIKGDLHMHTVWSDGHHSVRQMAEAARAKGYKYIAITDHSRSLRVAGGLSIEELLAQREEIVAVNRELTDIRVLAGVEMDILADGRLDYPDDVLQSLDYVIAAVHSGLQQDARTMTKRLLAAIENPYVHQIAHPTGRLLNRRDPYAFDVEEVFRRAGETGTILELNANPNRLDLNDRLLRRATEDFGVKIAVNTDAHRVENLDLMRYGIGTARRGWLTGADVVNAWSPDKLFAYLQRKRH